MAGRRVGFWPEVWQEIDPHFTHNALSKGTLRLLDGASGSRCLVSCAWAPALTSGQ
jgi:hypothetical protein